jgi:hypothetical protein
MVIVVMLMVMMMIIIIEHLHEVSVNKTSICSRIGGYFVYFSFGILVI